jgi:hypothetical protein
MGSGTNAVILIAIIVAAVLLWQGGYFNRFINKNGWSIDISVSPPSSGFASPTGHQSVDKGKPLMVNASASEGYSFQNWVLDGSQVSGGTPVISIPAQAINSTHTLVAVFIAKSPTFEITPAITASVGTTLSPSLSRLFYIQNHGAATITNIQLKLNDPYGVFTSATVSTGWLYVYVNYNPVGGWWDIATENCLNTWSPNLAMDFNGASAQTMTLNAGATNFFLFGDMISSSIQAGTYHLSWSIKFTVSSGSFSSSPILTIPWDVTVIG